MKLTISFVVLVFLFGCGKPPETGSVEDNGEVELTEEETPEQQQLSRFLSDFEVAHDGYPLIGFTQENERTDYTVQYLFEDDNLIWMQSVQAAREGGDVENHFMQRDPEGTSYLTYGNKNDGSFGYAGMDGGDWYTVETNEDYEPYIIGRGEENKFEWEKEYQETMEFVRSNKEKFNHEDAWYTYKDQKNKRTYKFSEVLFEANLLSSTSFNPEMIKGYLNWWYPLHEDASGKMVRHKPCSGDDEYIKITVEAGNYRWEEEGSGTTIVYLIKGFEESEGDAFYATIERNGNRFKKTMVKPEFEEGGQDKLYIDGRVYTSEPKNYDVIEMKCD